MSRPLTHDHWAKAPWYEAGLELDYRAKVYSSLDRTPSATEATQGVVLYNQIPALLNNKPVAGQWAWVFAPLISKLLSQWASWICLGYFIGDTKRAERRWLYFFSENLSYNYEAASSESARLSEFARAYRHISYFAKFPDLAGPAILLTSQIMERLTVNAQHAGSSALTGSFLVANFRTCNPFQSIWDSKHNEEQVARNVLAIDCQRLYGEHEKLGLGLRHTILADAVSDADINQIMLQLRATFPELSSILDFISSERRQNRFSQASHRYTTQLHRDIPSGEINTIEDAYLDPDQEYRDLLRDLLRRDDAQARLKRYVAWLHDVNPELGGIVTIPAWLPGVGNRGRSGAIIACVRPEISIPLASMMEFAGAFRLGCTALATTPMEQRGGVLHHVPKVFAAAMSELEEYRKRHTIEAPNCPLQFEIPEGFLLAVRMMWEYTGDIRNRPRWPRLEQELIKNGFTAQLVDYLFNNVAGKLGIHRLVPARIDPAIDQYAKLLVVSEEDESNPLRVGEAVSSDECIFLLILMADLLTEAWEHATRWAVENNCFHNPMVTAYVSRARVILENSCSVNEELISTSSQKREIRQLVDRIPNWRVQEPDPELVRQGIWRRVVEKHDATN